MRGFYENFVKKIKAKAYLGLLKTIDMHLCIYLQIITMKPLKVLNIFTSLLLIVSPEFFDIWLILYQGTKERLSALEHIRNCASKDL